MVESAASNQALWEWKIVFWFELQRLRIVGEVNGNEGKAQGLGGGGRFRREKETGWKWVSLLEQETFVFMMSA